MKSRFLYHRIKILLVLTLAVFLFLLCLLALSIAKPVEQPNGWLFALAAAMLAVLVLLWVLRFLKPCWDLMQWDENFTGRHIIDQEYRPPLYWSEASRALLKKYQEITDRKKIMELSVESSRYMALQQQINPHFLYNTLDAIRSDMMIEGSMKIADTVEALSKYFAYAVSNMEQLTTIQEELNNVRDYFLIQEYRFEGRIRLEIDDGIGDQAIRELHIPRLTLQPLVENAIIHGLETSEQGGVVTIRLQRSERFLTIHVLDNGEGMDEESLARLNDRLRRPFKQWERNEKKRGGIALDNVNSRIRFLFGEEYGLRAFSMLGAGTDISVLLPNLQKEL